VLWLWAGGGLPLPQDKSPPTVARRVIHIGPEPWQWGSGSLALGAGVGVVGMGGCIAGCAHPLEKSAPGFVDASIHRLDSDGVGVGGMEVPYGRGQMATWQMRMLTLATDNHCCTM
jgi:hypothetical protein